MRPRTQDALALEAAPGVWFLVHVSPDVHRQIDATPALHPRAGSGGPGAGGRASPIRGAVLLNGDLDHTLGLFSLREGTPLVLHVTAAVRRGLLEQNVIARTLQRFPGQLVLRSLEIDRPVELSGPEGVVVTAVAISGKVPKHLEGLAAPSPEDNVGLWIDDRRTGKRAVVATAVGALGPWVGRAEGADALFFDGTFWSDDELCRLGLGTARAADMAHLPVGGEDGSLALLAGRRFGRRIYTHINNTNPLLDEGSAERRAVEEAGWEVAEDGMEIEL